MSSEEDPCPRAFHFASTVADELTFVCGGLTSGGDEKTLHAFSQLEEVWKSRTTTGVSLPKLYEGGCTLSGNSIYLFGGLDGDQAYGELYSLDTEEMEWKKVSTGPMQCSGCGFVHYRNKLITFGGCGPQPATTQPGATYQEIAGGQGQNNQLQIFDLEEGECLHCIVYLYTSSFINRRMFQTQRGISDLKITTGHWSFSMQNYQMASHFPKWLALLAHHQRKSQYHAEICYKMAVFFSSVL